MFQTVCNQVKKDNLTAVQEGLLPVKCISLDIIKSPNSCFLWSYIRMEVAGIQFDFIETGIKDSPTFIFSNVRHSHLMQIA